MTIALIKNSLHGLLSSFGLNPCDWTLDFSNHKLQNSNEDEVQIHNIFVRSRNDKTLAFIGHAHAKQNGLNVRVSWQDLALSL